MTKRNYHTFILGGYYIAVPQNNYQQIIHHDLFDKSPPLPFLIKCIYNDGTDIFPVIDTRLKLGMRAFDSNKSHCMLIDQYSLSNNKDLKIGLLMDNYTGIHLVSSKNVQLSSKGLIDEFGSFIKGICRINSTEHLIISFQNIFTSEELEEFYSAYHYSKVQPSYTPVYNK